MEHYIDVTADHIFLLKFQLPLANSGIRTLLMHYKWDPERLIREYFDTIDRGNIDDFFKNANVPNPFDEMPIANTCDSEPTECEICCDTTDVSDILQIVVFKSR